jgi:hypothetical protein
MRANELICVLQEMAAVYLIGSSLFDENGTKAERKYMQHALNSFVDGQWH